MHLSSLWIELSCERRHELRCTVHRDSVNVGCAERKLQTQTEQKPFPLKGNERGVRLKGKCVDVGIYGTTTGNLYGPCAVK